MKIVRWEGKRGLINAILAVGGRPVNEAGRYDPDLLPTLSDLARA
jgi:hypothetical protein